MNASPSTTGSIWSREIFSGGREYSTIPSLKVVDGEIDGRPWRAIAVVPDPTSRFVRARRGEIGLDQGLALATAVYETPRGAALLALVDVPGQAFGKREEAAGLQLALAAAVEAYTMERQAGRAIFALLVGKAISGAFLAHGMQAGWIGALNSPEVEIQVMAAASVARVARVSLDEIARVASTVPATARNVESFASFGVVDEVFNVQIASQPSASEIDRVRASLSTAHLAGLGLRSPRDRLNDPRAAVHRSPALAARARIAAEWNA